jgi:hypothetical protein
LRGRRVFSKALAQIHAVEAKRLDLYEHLSWSECRLWDLINEESFSWALLASNVYTGLSVPITLRA